MDERQNTGDYINSIVRMTNILNLYHTMNVEYLGVTDISRELNLHKTAVFRIVKTLEYTGWLVQDGPNGKYKLGPKLIVLSSAPTTNFPIDDVIEQEMKRLRDLFNEDVVLTGLIDGYLAICIEKIKSNNALHISSRVGRTIGMTKGSTGKVLLAYLTPENQEKAIQLECPSMEDAEKERLMAKLETIRARGFAFSASERDEGVASAAVPIFDREGKILYSLAIVGEENRMKKKGLDDMLDALHESVLQIHSIVSNL